MKIKINSNTQKLLSDTYTPVGLYLNLRDIYPNALLLESSDYNKKQNSFSYICLQPIATFKADRDYIYTSLPSGKSEVKPLVHNTIADELQSFVKQFEVDTNDVEFLTQGLFGYTTYDAIPLHHPINFSHEPFQKTLVMYQYFRFVLVFNHFNNELYLIENLTTGETSELKALSQKIQQTTLTPLPFVTTSETNSNFTDQEFLNLIEKGKEHCYKGDVFQVVLSRRFYTGFKGDEFNVYRALRSINPSPYLFYFDYGDVKIMGSSPEAQITVKEGLATIHPIAGTFKRSGNKEVDEELAALLQQDPKENAEHVMLVDLARNDLSINSNSVKVAQYKSIEMYSHVIHMVSKVEARLSEGQNPLELFFNTYPAGTLSGAPKHRAMQIIDELEQTARGFYGGSVGIIGLDGSVNAAIFIRSLISKNQQLYYQAGCGVVTQSNTKSELEEIYNKVKAVEKAIDLAQKL